MKGFFVYGRFTSMQHPSFKDAFSDFFKEVKPKRLLEIGTAQGGTCVFFRDKLNELGFEDSPILTFEIETCESHKVIEKIEGITLSHENIFKHSYLEFEKPELISDFINKEGTTVVCCDGGAKRYELNLISTLLKPGDYILAHDYAPTLEYSKEHMVDKIWNWAEIRDEHIDKDALKLEQVYFDNFIKAAWCCFRKLA